MRYPCLMATLLALCLGLVTASQQQPARQVNHEVRFKQLDRNGDGKLTPQELPGQWFGKLDADGDGLVTPEEARSGFANRQRR